MWKPKEAIEYAGAGDAGDSDQPDVVTGRAGNTLNV